MRSWAPVDQAETCPPVDVSGEFWLIVVAVGRDHETLGMAMGADPDIIDIECLDWSLLIITDMLEIEKPWPHEISGGALQDVDLQRSLKSPRADWSGRALSKVCPHCRWPVCEVVRYDPAAHAKS